MKTLIEDRPAYNVIGFPHKGPYPTIGQSFGRLGQWASENGIPFGQSIAVYHDDPQTVAAADLRSEALLIVDQPMQAPEGMVAYTIPAGKYLIGIHMGSYEGLGPAWQEMFDKEVPAHHAQIRNGPFFELYVNDCTKTPIEEVRTDICIPIA